MPRCALAAAFCNEQMLTRIACANRVLLPLPSSPCCCALQVLLLPLNAGQHPGDGDELHRGLRPAGRLAKPGKQALIVVVIIITIVIVTLCHQALCTCRGVFDLCGVLSCQHICNRRRHWIIDLSLEVFAAVLERTRAWSDLAGLCKVGSATAL